MHNYFDAQFLRSEPILLLVQNSSQISVHEYQFLSISFSLSHTHLNLSLSISLSYIHILLVERFNINQTIILFVRFLVDLC